MRIQVRRVLLALCCCCLILTTGLAAQQPTAPDPGPLPKYVAEPISLFTTGLGPFTRKISSTNPEAQAFFDQGFQMMYAFAKLDAVRSFREAWKRDPDCAICYWGEAWAWGSYLNGPMSAEQSPFAYCRRAEGAVAEGPGHPGRTGDSSTRCRCATSKNFDVKTRVEQDKAYAEAMQKRLEKYPERSRRRHALRRRALPARAAARHARRQRAEHQAAARRARVGAGQGPAAPRRLPPLRARDRIHGAARQGRSLRAVSRPQSIPGASHINHMPSHTFNEVGRWGDSVRANLEAWHSDLKADIGEGFAIYPDHNLHMLLYAASMDGQGAIAMQAGKDYAKRTNDTMYQVLTLIRFGRFDEVLEVTKRPEREIPAASGTSRRATRSCARAQADFAQGLPRARAEDRRDRRRRSSATIRRSGCSACSPASSKARSRAPTRICPAPSPRSSARSSRTTSSSTTSRSRCPSRRGTGWARRCSKPKRSADAERVYREDLEGSPAQRLVAARPAAGAEGAGQDPTPKWTRIFAASWARSDHWIRASRF